MKIVGPSGELGKGGFVKGRSCKYLRTGVPEVPKLRTAQLSTNIARAQESSARSFLEPVLSSPMVTNIRGWLMGSWTYEHRIV